MFCRRAWQRVGPLARRAFQPPSRTAAPVRHMAFGVPGGSSNMTYFLLCGGGLTAAVVYAYKTVSGDSERYEDRLANMGSATRASLPPAPAVETAPVEEPAPATEVITESVPTPAGPVAETAAEPVTEVTLDSEVVVAAAEPVVTEEATTPAASEASPVAATVETPAEALAAESAEAMPDLRTAVKIFASSTAEIAAASVAEKSLVTAVHQLQEDGKGLDSALEALQPDVPAATIELVPREEAEDMAAVLNKELKSTEASAGDGVADVEDVEAVVAEEVTEENEAAASPPEESTASAPAVEELEEVETVVLETAPDEALLSTEASLEDASPAEETPPAEEATTSAEAPAVHAVSQGETTTDAIETSVEDAAAEASAVEEVEAAAVVAAPQVAAASICSNLEVFSAADPEPTAEAPAHEVTHRHSCHSAPPESVQVSPPAAVGGQLVTEDITQEAKEVASLVEGQKTMLVMTAPS